MELTQNDKIVFQEKGIVHLKNFISKKLVSEVKSSILAELDRLKLRANGKLNSSKFQSQPIFQQIGNLSQMVKIGPKLDQLFSSELIQIMTQLLDLKTKTIKPNPQLLLSFPHKEKWLLNNLNWHLDLAVPPKDEVSGVQVFVLIDDIQPKGGATLALAGSHKLHYLKEAKSGNAHSVLRQNEIFSALFDSSTIQEEKLLKPQNVNGVEVSISEMCGKAGDIFLMDMRVLHSPSINATKNIRMMATLRIIK